LHVTLICDVQRQASPGGQTVDHHAVQQLSSRTTYHHNVQQLSSCTTYFTPSAALVPLAAAPTTAAPAHGSSSTMSMYHSTQSYDVASDVAAKRSHLQLQETLLYSGNLCDEVMQWQWQQQQQQQQYRVPPATVTSTWCALSHWRSYYIQQQYTAKLPLLEHLSRELERCRVSEQSHATLMCQSFDAARALSNWSLSVKQASQAAHARVQQVCTLLLIPTIVTL
jgi:hypothetical protein